MVKHELSNATVRLILGRTCLAVLLILFGFGGLLELRHHSKYGHFFGYGIHADVISEYHDLGIPGIQTAYCVMLTNLTLFPAKFEARKLPGGFAGRGYKYHDQVQKWDQALKSWVTVMDSVPVGSVTGWDEPNTILKVWPGQSIYPIGWDALAARDGINKGDTVRIIVFSAFRESAAFPGKTIYSPEFTVHP